MSEQLREQLSALMDGAVSGDELRFLLRRLDADTDSVQTWSRYQFASGVLHRQTMLPLRVRADFSETVMLRIAQESSQPAARRRSSGLLRWAGGGAIAAVVAVAALVTTRPAGENQNPMDEMPSIVTVPAVPISAPQIDRLSTAPLPALTNFDYAQPASFDTGVIPLSRYDLRRRYDAGADNVNELTPYVLLTTPARAPQISSVPAPSSGPSSQPEQPQQQH